MAEAANQLYPGYDAYERDQEEARRAREFRMSRVASGAFRAERQRYNAFGGAGKAAQRLQQLEKTIKNTRTLITLGGALASFTIIGIIWTLLQWNLQAVWQIFALPGNKYFGLSWWLVPVILLADVVLFILTASLMVAAYFMQNKGDAVCALPQLVEIFKSDGLIGFMQSIAITITRWFCS